MRFVAVQHCGHQAMSRRANRLASLELGIYLPGYQADAVEIDIGADPANRISGGHSRPEPLSPEGTARRLLQGIEAAQPGQEHHGH